MNETDKLSLYYAAGYWSRKMLAHVKCCEADKKDMQHELYVKALSLTEAKWIMSGGANELTFAKRCLVKLSFHAKREFIKRNTTFDEVTPELVDTLVAPKNNDAETAELFLALLNNLPPYYRQIVEALYLSGGSRNQAFHELKEKHNYPYSIAHFYYVDVPKAKELVKEFLDK